MSFVEVSPFLPEHFGPVPGLRPRSAPSRRSGPEEAAEGAIGGVNTVNFMSSTPDRRPGDEQEHP
jgi:hypothetical protein